LQILKKEKELKEPEESLEDKPQTAAEFER
jgi:hypothetical protein